MFVYKESTLIPSAFEDHRTTAWTNPMDETERFCFLIGAAAE